jgi:cytochrome P450
VNQKLLELAENYDPSRPEMLEEPSRPFDVFDVMRTVSPVKRVEHQPRMSGRQSAGWVLTRYDDVTTVFRDDEHFSNIGILGSSEDERIPTEEVGLDDVDPRTMARMAQRIPMLLDPPAFTDYRRLMMPLLSAKALAKREDATRMLVNQLIDGFIDTGSCDLHDDLCKPLPGILTCQLLGLPTEQWKSFADPLDEFLQSEGARALTPGVAEHYEDSPFARMQVPGMMAMLEIAEERRQSPNEDIISELTGMSLDGRRLGVYELGAMLSILLSGGTETTTSALGSALVYLGRNPGLRTVLAADPSGIPRFVEEVFRMWPPLMTFFRTVKEPFSFHGHHLSPGEIMYLVIAGANRDPTHFESPNEFRYERTPNRHVTFTVGLHRCLGSTLARLEMRVAIEELLKWIPEYDLREADVELLPHFSSAYGYRRVGASFDPSSR